MQIQRDSSFMDWRNNLLVAGMVDGAMYRLILSKESVVATERIATGFRIRDFIVSDEGLLILSSDEGRLLFYQSTHPQLQN
jgi:glucose/arabinose dehydrogenase